MQEIPGLRHASSPCDNRMLEELLKPRSSMSSLPPELAGEPARQLHSYHLLIAVVKDGVSGSLNFFNG